MPSSFTVGGVGSAVSRCPSCRLAVASSANSPAASTPPTTHSIRFVCRTANGPWLVIITPNTTSTSVPPTYTMSCAAPRNSAPRRKYSPATPTSANSSHTPARTMLREAATPTAPAAVTAATAANSTTARFMGDTRLEWVDPTAWDME
jgi:hypothetical protein